MVTLYLLCATADSNVRRTGRRCFMAPDMIDGGNVIMLHCVALWPPSPASYCSHQILTKSLMYLLITCILFIVYSLKSLFDLILTWTALKLLKRLHFFPYSPYSYFKFCSSVPSGWAGIWRSDGKCHLPSVNGRIWVGGGGEGGGDRTT